MMDAADRRQTLDGPLFSPQNLSDQVLGPILVVNVIDVPALLGAPPDAAGQPWKAKDLIEAAGVLAEWDEDDRSRRKWQRVRRLAQ